MRILFVPILLLFLSSCMNKNNNIQTGQVEEPMISDSLIKKSEIKPQKEDIIKNKYEFKDGSISLNGFLGLLQVDNYSGDVLKIFNLDSTLFSEIDFAGPESKEYYTKLDSLISQLDFYAYHPDYALFLLKSNVNANFYEIQTKNKELKLISKESQICKFYTWSEFIMSDNYVSIKGLNYRESMYIYKEPRGSSDFFKLAEETGYLLNAKNIKDEWIQIRAESIISDTIKPFTGWIKWRDDKKILIDFWFIL